MEITGFGKTTCIFSMYKILHGNAFDFFSENKIFNKLLSSENYDLIRKYILN